MQRGDWISHYLQQWGVTCSPSADPKEQATQRELVQVLLSSAKLSPLFSCVLAVVLAYQIWGEVEQSTASAWLAATFLVNLLRQRQVRNFPVELQSNLEDLEWHNGESRTFFWGTFASAFVWGLAPLFIFPLSGVMQMFMVLLACGLISGAMSTLGALRPVFLCFLSLVILPLAVRLFFEMTPFHLATGLLALCYFFFLNRASREYGSSLRGNISSRFETESLTEELRIKSQEEECMNALLRKALAEAEIASKTKSEFLANMSHELRTPMNAVLGMTDLALEENDIKQVKEYLEHVRESGGALLRLLNDILDLSKVESGQLVMKTSQMEPRSVISSCIGLLEGTARSSDIKLNLNFSEDLPWFVILDPLRVSQVIMNIVGNAIKFSPPRSEVRIDVGLSGDARMRIVVEDKGVGISEEDLGTIFQPFTQADSSSTRAFGGSGLGLSIAQQIVSILGGEISVESTLGEGSTFTVSLPFERVARERVLETPGEESRDSQAVDTNEMRILLAEDNPVNQKLLKIILNKAGHDVSTASNGEEAVKSYKDGGFDLILMDCQMPVMNGYEATEAIRALEDELSKGRIPIVAVTAHAMQGDRNRCIASGMDDYITKPIDRKELYALLERFSQNQ